MSRSERAAQLLDAPVVGRLLARSPAWNGVLVLGYHRISDSLPSNDPGVWSATSQGFDAQLAFLTRHFDVIGPDDLTAALTTGGRHVLLTFDDGYRDNYEIALPVLREHGATATFFIIPGFIDTPRVAWWDELAWMVRNSERGELPAGGPVAASIPFDEPERELAVAAVLALYKQLPGERTEELMDFVAGASGTGRAVPGAAADTWITWDMARELRDAGMTVGGHTADHRVLARIPADAQRDQVMVCARRLEAELGHPMRYFSYPVGARDTFDADTRACLADAGVELAFSLYGGYTRRAKFDAYDVRRTHVSVFASSAMFRSTARAPQLLARY